MTCTGELKEHEHLVTSLVVIGERELFSGSADYTIKVWNRETMIVKTLVGHESSVNGVNLAFNMPSGRRDDVLVCSLYLADSACLIGL